MKNKSPQYYITYERDDRGYVASAPAVPGCAVYGKTLQEAYANIQTALRECLEVIQKFKKSPPQETIRPDAIKKLSFVKLREYAKT